MGGGRKGGKDVPCSEEGEELLSDHVVCEIVGFDQDGHDIDVLVALHFDELFLFSHQLLRHRLQGAGHVLQLLVEFPRQLGDHPAREEHMRGEEHGFLGRRLEDLLIGLDQLVV